MTTAASIIIIIIRQNFNSFEIAIVYEYSFLLKVASTANNLNQKVTL